MDDVVNLSNEELKDIGVNKLKHRKLIMQETQKMRKGSSSLAASAKEKVSEITVTNYACIFAQVGIETYCQNMMEQLIHI